MTPLSNETLAEGAFQQSSKKAIVIPILKKEITLQPNKSRFIVKIIVKVIVS
jgi:hypothetical protein